MNSQIPEEEFFEQLAAETQASGEPVTASPRLKSRIYSALALRQASTGPLASLTESRTAGLGLCVFEELVQIAPIGEGLKSLNICRVCHARVLGEYLEHARIYWRHCPYVRFQKTG